MSQAQRLGLEPINDSVQEEVIEDEISAEYEAEEDID